MYKIKYLLFLAATIIMSCVTLDQQGEPPASEDGTAPDNYNPVFITKTNDYDPNQNVNPGIDISTIDVRQPNLVKVKFNVVDSGKVHLKGISGSNFSKFWCEIIDSINGKEIKIKKPKVYEVSDNDKMNLAFSMVMDHSGSMGDDRAKAVQNAIESFILKKEDNEKVALIKYDDKVVTESGMTNNKSELLGKFRRNGLDGFGGLTATTDGIYAGLKELAGLPKSIEKYLIVFTDGWDNSSKYNRDSVIRVARMNNIMICAVDFGNNINEGYMKYYSDSTSGIYKHIYRTDEFQYLFQDLYNRSKNYYVLEFRPNEFGNHKISFKICFPNDTVSAEATYNNIPDIGALGVLSINFDFNKATVKKESEEDIDQIYTLLKAYPTMVIELRGHTDSLNKTGDADYNFKLSQKRADAVKDIIVKKGISASRIQTKGMGDSEPVATNETEDGRARNRRTEYIVLQK